MLLLRRYILTAGFITSCILLTLCKKNTEFNIDVKVKEKIIVKKGYTYTVNLQLINLSENDIVIDEIKSSCQCIIHTKEKFKIASKKSKNLKISINADELGKNKESIIFTSHLLSSFKIYHLDYEVIN